ncbi:MAG: protein kinase domain-containing protein [Terracidiphilus sp.]
MEQFDGWEAIDENDDYTPKLLGKGGQGEVYLARSPQQAARRRKAEEMARQNLVQVGGGRWSTKELAKCLMELGGPDPDDSLGALKRFIIPSENKDEEAKAIGRLESEVKALRGLQGQPAALKLLHANVDQRFIVTEYHRRGTLNKHLGAFQGNVLAALEAFKPLVDGVNRIHQEGAIHRDIKTENIFVSASGDLILGDFGIVFFQGSSERLTTTYERVGSHYWMAPWAYENARLELGRISPALDIFPLAKVLWSMIAGKNGFPYWEYERAENNLERLFPNDPVMPLVNKRVFSKRIVRDENKCDGSAASLLADVQELIPHLKIGLGYKPEGASAWSCSVCGRGTYQATGMKHQLKGHRPGGPAAEQEIVLFAYICDYCGHAELFKK